jgi:hypothetical protein
VSGELVEFAGAFAAVKALALWRARFAYARWAAAPDAVELAAIDRMFFDLKRLRRRGVAAYVSELAPANDDDQAFDGVAEP